MRVAPPVQKESIAKAKAQATKATTVNGNIAMMFGAVSRAKPAKPAASPPPASQDSDVAIVLDSADEDADMGATSREQNLAWLDDLQPYEFHCKAKDLHLIMTSIVVTKAADYSGSVTEASAFAETQRHLRLLLVVALFDMVIQVRPL